MNIGGLSSGVVLRLTVAAVTAGSTVVLARVLPLSVYGELVYLLSIMSILTIPSKTGVPALSARFIPYYLEEERQECLRGFVHAVFAFAFGSALLAGTIFLLFEGLNERALLVTVILVLLALLGTTGAVFRGFAELTKSVLSESVVLNVLFVVGVLGAGFVGFGWSTTGVLMIYAGAGVLALAASLRWLSKETRRHIPSDVTSEREVGRWVRVGLPLALVASFQVINMRADVVMVGFLMNESAAGQYHVASRIGDLCHVVLVGINFAIGPALAALFARGDLLELQETITRASRLGLFLTLPLVALVVTAAEPLLGIVFGDDFVPAAGATRLLAAAQLLNAGVGSVGIVLSMTGYERDSAWGMGIAALANIVLNFLFIPLLGLEGGALATGLSLLLWNGILIALVRKRLGIVPGPIGRRSRAS